MSKVEDHPLLLRWPSFSDVSPMLYHLDGWVPADLLADNHGTFGSMPHGKRLGWPEVWTVANCGQPVLGI